MFTLNPPLANRLRPAKQTVKAQPHTEMMYTHDGTLQASCDASKSHAMLCGAFSNILEIWLTIFQLFILLFSNSFQPNDELLRTDNSCIILNIVLMHLSLKQPTPLQKASHGPRVVHMIYLVSMKHKPWGKKKDPGTYPAS